MKNKKNTKLRRSLIKECFKSISENEENITLQKCIECVKDNLIADDNDIEMISEYYNELKANNK